MKVFNIVDHLLTQYNWAPVLHVEKEKIATVSLQQNQGSLVQSNTPVEMYLVTLKVMERLFVHSISVDNDGRTNK